MHRKRFGGPAILILGALALAGCSAPNEWMAHLNSLTDPSGWSQSGGWQSLSADYQGTLHPATNTQAMLAGNTVVFKHPWVNRGTSGIQENSIYFNSDGTADSMAWTKRPWYVNDNNVCAIGNGEESCFSLYTDDTGQTFLFSDELDVLSKVTSMQPGDTLQLAARRDERIREDQASTDAANALVLGGIVGALSTPPSAPASEPVGTRVCDSGIVQEGHKNCPQPERGF